MPAPDPPAPPRVNELLRLIRQRRNGTYSGASDIVTSLDPDEFSAFKTALKAGKFLSELDKLRWYWVQSTSGIHQIHIRMTESNLHGTFSGLLRELFRKRLKKSLQQLPPDSSQARDAFKRLQFFKGGQIEPIEDSYEPDAAIGYTPKDGGPKRILCIEVAVSQTWNAVTAKAKSYFQKHMAVHVVITLGVPDESGTNARYQIWSRVPDADPTNLEAQCSRERVFRKRNGAIQAGDLKLYLKDFCYDILDQDNIAIHIPHHLLVKALKEAEEYKNPNNPQPGCSKSNKRDESEEDESEDDEGKEREWEEIQRLKKHVKQLEKQFKLRKGGN